MKFMQRPSDFLFSYLPVGEASTNIFLYSEPLLSFLCGTPNTEMQSKSTFQGHRCSPHLTPKTGEALPQERFFWQSGFLRWAAGWVAAPHLMLKAIRGLSSRFCQGLFLSSPWSSSSSSSSSSS